MSEREDTKFLVDWVREWVGKMHRHISCEERGRIADEMCCEWSGSGIGASYQEYMIEYNPTLANVPPVARDNAGLLERLRIQAQVIRGDIEVVVNESGETDDYEHSTDGLLDTVEEAADAIESLQKATTRTRERYNLAASRVSELDAQVRELREALGPVAAIAANGIHGGPMTTCRAVYEDATDENSAAHKGWLSPEDFERARSALSGQPRDIPKGVYWSREAGNFYREATNRGMGLEFYDAWQERKDEFPAKATSAPGLDLYLGGQITLSGQPGESA